MSEFKFACPICTQHITADSSAAGTQLSCPTCFRKIVVPQAPTSVDRKFILSAAEVNKPRLPIAAPATSAPPARPARSMAPIALVVALVLTVATGATLFLLRDKIFKKDRATTGAETEGTADRMSAMEPMDPAISNAVAWLPDVAMAPYPADAASGKIRDREFRCGRAILDGGTLTLRHGRTSTTDLGLNIYLPTKRPEELNGRSLNVTTNNATAPWVTLRWKEGQASESETIKAGYALKVEFGSIKGNRLPGKIYICLPDEKKSRVAGTFVAEIRKPRPAVPAQPKAASVR